MTLSDIVNQEQTEYFQSLVSCLKESRKQGYEVVSELLIELNTPQIPTPYRLYRADLVYKQNGEVKILEVAKDTFGSFDSHPIIISPNIPGMLHPFRWNGLEWKISGDIQNWNLLEQWVNEWMDLDDVREASDNDFSGLVHNVTEPVFENGFWTFSIDMGSAGIDALNSLFGIFEALGVTSFEMGRA